MSVLDVRDVSVRFGGIVALDELSFSVERGEICGLIGPNGAGKTTLFNVVSRIYQPTSGRLEFKDKEILDVPAHGIAKLGIARTFQNLALFPRLTVLENVMVGAHSKTRRQLRHRSRCASASGAKNGACSRTPWTSWPRSA